MSNNLKTIQTAYRANTRPRHHNGGRLTQKRFNNYTRMPDMITNENGYYWREGFNKMYGRHTRLVEPGQIADQLKDFTLKVDKLLRMTDFFYDGISKKDLKLIRDRFKKGPINLKGYNRIVKDYSSNSHRYTYVYIAWVINDSYIINDVDHFIELLKNRSI